MRQNMYGGKPVQNFGGLSFANNQFQFADPAFDEYHALTQQREAKWHQAKQGIESTQDFITNQSVLGADKHIQENAADKFTGSVKQFVDNGRYEEASFALDNAVRDFKNDKGFAAATTNYATYATWAQGQREKTGFSEDEKSTYINGLASEYEGVKVHDDGSVSGGVNTRDMGEFQNVQEKIAGFIKGWDKDVQDQVMNEFHRGAFEQIGITDKRTHEYTNAGNVMSYVKNFIDQDPEIQHFLETKRIINDKAPAHVLTSKIYKALDNSTVDNQKFETDYKSMKFNSKTAIGKAALAKFEDRYAVRDGNGEVVKNDDGSIKVNPFLYNLERQMISSGGVDPSKLPANAQLLATNINESMAMLSSAGYNSKNINDIKAKEASGATLTNIEKVALQADVYKKAMINIDESLYKSEQAYQAFLPVSGVKDTISQLHSYTDEGAMWLNQRAIEAAEVEKINALVVDSDSEIPETYSSLIKNGVAGIETVIDKAKSTMDIQAAKTKSLGTALTTALNQYNKDNGTNLVLPNLDNITAENCGELGVISSEVAKVLEKLSPSTYKDYKESVGTLVENSFNHTNLNKLYADAEKYAAANDPNYPTVENSKWLIDDYMKPDAESMRKPLTQDEALAELRKGYRNRTDETVMAKYMKQKINSGVTTNHVNVYAARNAPRTKVNAEFQDAIKGMDDAILSKMSVLKNITYKAMLNGHTFTDNDGLNINTDLLGDGVSDQTIKDLQFTGFQTNGVTGNVEYYANVVTGDDTFGKSPHGTCQIIITDSDGQFKEILEGLSKQGGQHLQPEAHKAIENIQASQQLSGEVNFKAQRKALYENGIAPIMFKNPISGVMEKYGTIRADYSVNSQGETNHGKQTVIVDYFDMNGDTEVIRNKQFDTTGEAQKFLADKYRSMSR